MNSKASGFKSAIDAFIQRRGIEASMRFGSASNPGLAGDS
jgi:hypothetical protein